MRPLTDEEVARHNAAYTRAWELAKPYMLLAESPKAAPLSRRARRQLGRAIDSVREALAIAPDNWSALWLLGKVYQRLDRHEDALESFHAAFLLNPSRPDVARETGLTALAVGDAPLALRCCTAASASSPHDSGLLANLALAYLIGGEVDRASATAREAVERDPGDTVSQQVLARIVDVQTGRRPVPKCV